MAGKDYFSFVLLKEDGKLYGSQWEDTVTNYTPTPRNILKSPSGEGCNKNAPNGGYYCAALIIFDNFQIKEDYPW